MTDNEIAAGIVNQTIKQNKLYAMNMQYFWLIDQSKDGKIKVQ